MMNLSSSPRTSTAELFSIKRLIVAALILFAGVSLYYWLRPSKKIEPPQPYRVRTATASKMDLPMYINALGTVTPESTVVVKSRVDGELIAIHFTEGESVTAGQLLAEIDPRAYEIRLKEAEGALARDKALLKDARLDLNRYRKLILQEAISPQQLQAQEALVGQYEGAVRIDEANIADATLQLGYCSISAPISGRLGLRQADLGSMIYASDASGIVIITQMQPMQVLLTLPEKQALAVREALGQGKIPVLLRDQDNMATLAEGTLLTLDNRIDTSTGTVKAKALLDNKDERLFPNQFVNAQLRLTTLLQVTAIPSTAIQRNDSGFFVYVVSNDTVSVRPVTAGHESTGFTEVKLGLEPGEVVVTDGVDKLRDGSSIRISN